MSNGSNDYYLDKFFFCVVSRGRPAQIPFLKEICGTSRIYFAVPSEERHDYIKYGVVPDKLIPMKYSTLGEKRAMVIEHAKANHPGKDIIMMDDDLKDKPPISIVTEETIHLNKDSNKRKTEPITFAVMVDYMKSSLDKFPKLKAVGVPQIPKLFFISKQEYSTNLFVVANIYLIKHDIEVNFDRNLKNKVDYDFTLSNIQKYGGMLRCNRILATYQHWNNRGGLFDIRNNEVSRQSITYLKQKWGDNIIRDNTKRPNEILLRVKMKRK
jgi:hypothetical protein